MARAHEEPESTPRRGRPQADEPGTTVSAWLRNSEHDQLVRLANKQDTSVSSLVRTLVVQRLRP